MTPPRSDPAADPVITVARAIAAAHRALLARDAVWQRLESALAHKARQHGLSLLQATRSGLPQARALRTLDRSRRRARRDIQRALAKLCATPAATPAGALAKLDLAVLLADPDAPTEPHWALIRAATADFHRGGLTGL